MTYDLEKIRHSLPACGKFSAGRMYYFNEIESTNTWLIGQTVVDGKFCIAGQQTAGRGRRGRSWLSREGGSILLSMGWALGRQYVPGLSLASGLAVTAALADAGINSAKLKWPNDVFIGDAKLGGILVEVSGCNAVIGLGLNLDLGSHESVERANVIDQPWTDLASQGIEYDINEILLGLLRHHTIFIDQCIESGFSQFSQQWNALHEFQDQEVDVQSQDEHFNGIARGVDDQGALMVETARGVTHIHSGDVSVRRPGPGQPEPGGSGKIGSAVTL
jgi:BirA family biotin operon repressor/biotin-[acetyl-CoA-carboxylase] ligase